MVTKNFENSFHFLTKNHKNQKIFKNWWSFKSINDGYQRKFYIKTCTSKFHVSIINFKSFSLLRNVKLDILMQNLSRYRALKKLSLKYVLRLFSSFFLSLYTLEDWKSSSLLSRSIFLSSLCVAWKHKHITLFFDYIIINDINKMFFQCSLKIVLTCDERMTTKKEATKWWKIVKWVWELIFIFLFSLLNIHLIFFHHAKKFMKKSSLFSKFFFVLFWHFFVVEKSQYFYNHHNKVCIFKRYKFSWCLKIHE